MPQTTQTSQTNRLALYNAKGGTGKTTVGINVAGGLAQRGADVLFVDFDPQGNATEGLGLVDAYDADGPTLFDCLFDPEADTSELVQEHVEFDVLPSNVRMLNAERELVIDDYEGYHSVGYLDELLDTLEADGEWDYVIIDAPPFFGELTNNALYASRNVLVPALTESTSQRAVELLLDQMKFLENEEDIFVDEIAAVSNRIETNNEAEKMQKWMQSAFPDIPVFNIRKRVALQRAYGAGVSIFEHSESCDMEDVFLRLSDAVRAHFEDTNE